MSFVDLAPTVLSLAGLEIPRHMQGHAFLGTRLAPEQPFLYGFRGRMDERYDMVRSVRDKRYVYVRNFMPHRIYGEHLAYMFETPTTQVWKRLYDEGKLNAAQKQFWETKPLEELYDLTADRDEVHNLANSPQHQAILARLREAQHKLALDIRDVGLLPEHEIHQRSKGATPYQMGHDEAKYPCPRVIAAAESAASLNPSDTPKLLKALADSDSGVRYWAAQGFLMRKDAQSCGALLDDPAPAVRVVAAEGVARYGTDEDLAKALGILLDHASPARHGAYLAVLSLNAISALGKRASSLKHAIQALPVKDPNADPRSDGYVARLVEDISGTL